MFGTVIEILWSEWKYFDIFYICIYDSIGIIVYINAILSVLKDNICCDVFIYSCEEKKTLSF